jgi:predicted metal-binding protein
VDKSKAKCVVVIQCSVAHERCPGAGCATKFVDREDYFAGYGPDAKYYVSFGCGGCPGRRVGRLLGTLKKKVKAHQGIEPDEIVVHLATCVIGDNVHYPPCPHVKDIKTMIARRGLHFVEGSYVSHSPSVIRKHETGVYAPLPPLDNFT